MNITRMIYIAIGILIVSEENRLLESRNSTVIVCFAGQDTSSVLCYKREVSCAVL